MLINALIRIVNTAGIVVFILATYASLSLVTQSNAVAGPVIGQECTVGGCLFNAAATLDTTQVDDLRPGPAADAAAEGQDVLTLTYYTTPADLWDTLREAGFHGTTGDGCTCLYIPVGTEVAGEAGIYTATLDGWTLCRINVATGGRCTPRPIDVPIVAPLA